MTDYELRRRYFDWIYQLVFNNDVQKARRYHRLLEKLFSITFEYTIPLDRNRYEDGISLRYRFAYDLGVPYDEIDDIFSEVPCNVLEMMAALALRCEEHIMFDPDIGDRTGVWFWKMILSMHLDCMDDDSYDDQDVEDAIVSMMFRDYDSDGDGGLFYVHNSIYDMREVEIWTQMCAYLNSIE